MDRKAFYDEIDVTSVADEDMRRLKIMLSLVRNLGVRKFLDIGCMPAMTAYFAKNLGCRADGINISEKVVKSYGGSEIDLVCADAETTPLKGGYDLIICGELIEHLQDPDTFIVKLRSSLRDGGYLLLTIPNLASLFNRISLLFGWQPRGMNPSRKMMFNPFTFSDYNWGHISMFTGYAMKKFLSANGFKIVAVKGTYGGHTGERGLKGLLRALMSAKASFSEQLVFLAKKE